VLPAASSFLADNFELEGVSIAYADDHGDLLEAFTLGRRIEGIPHHSAELRSPPVLLQAGQVAAVPLLRGGRVIGALHALARVDLTPQRTRTFVSVAERVGTAVANARQFEREREAVRRLTELDRLQNEFLGTVSHELQTPITAILGFSSMLDEQYDDLSPEERRDFVGRVARNATSLSRLVRELLDFSRLGGRQFALNPHAVDLSELLASVVDQFAGLVERHRIVLDAPAGIWAVADTQAVERVVANLLSNAAKYSPTGTAINVTLSHNGDEARITVDDAGAGVSEADAPHVFHRFYRGSSPAAVGTRGAGIGLAVVKDLVERMEGHVSVGAAPTGGARFTVVLPVYKHEPASPKHAGQGRTP
jgi:signal transduction histidine kinase